MDRRLQLNELFVSILGTEDLPEERSRVYFQPPANVQMEYPCIVYSRDTTETQFADNNPYRLTKRYEVKVIDRDPDTIIPEKVAALTMCVHTTSYVADTLNHYVFTLYF